MTEPASGSAWKLNSVAVAPTDTVQQTEHANYHELTVSLVSLLEHLAGATVATVMSNLLASQHTVTTSLSIMLHLHG